MVLKKTIERLRERPHEERRAVAAGVALSTVGILLVGWGFMFVQGLGSGTSVMTQNTTEQPSVNTAAVQVTQQWSVPRATSTNPSDSLYYSITE